MLYSTTVNKLKKFKYINQCGFFYSNIRNVHNSSTWFFLITDGNPYVDSLFRYIFKRPSPGIVRNYVVVTNDGMKGFDTVKSLKEYLLEFIHAEWRVDEIIDLYKICKENKIVNYDEKVQENIGNQQKKDNIFRVFCRKWFGV